MNETTWINRAQTGDPNAFRHLVEENQSKVYHLLLGMVRDEFLAQDLTQMTFVKAWKALRSFRRHSSFWTWLYRIAYRLGVDHLRGTHRECSPLEDEDNIPSGEADPLEAVIGRERNQVLLSTLQQLPLHQRTAIILYYFQGVSYESISEITGRKLDTIRSDLLRGKARLKKLIVERAGWNDG